MNMTLLSVTQSVVAADTNAQLFLMKHVIQDNLQTPSLLLWQALHHLERALCNTLSLVLTSTFCCSQFLPCALCVHRDEMVYHIQEDRLRHGGTHSIATDTYDQHIERARSSAAPPRRYA